MIEGFEKYTYELTASEIRDAEIIRHELKTGGFYTNKELRTILGYNSDSKGSVRIRKIIHYLRVSGKLEFLLSSSKGYYVSKNYDEIKKCIKSLYQRADSISRVARSLENKLIEAEINSKIKTKQGLLL